MWQSRPYIFQVRCHLTQQILYLLVMCNVDGFKQQFTGSLKVFLWTVCRDGWFSGIWTLVPRPQLVPGSAVHFPLLGWTQRCDCRSSVLLGPLKAGVSGPSGCQLSLSLTFLFSLSFCFFCFSIPSYPNLAFTSCLHWRHTHSYHNVDNEIK